MVWFDIFVLQPVPYILKDFFVDGDFVTAGNKGMESSGWLPEDSAPYDFELRKNMGIAFKFPMVCALKLDHGVQTGVHALGSTTESCNVCHSKNDSFWKYLDYNAFELYDLQQPRTAQ